MAEINLLKFYPGSKRPIEERGELITPEHRKIARRFGKEYFDGNRLFGYGGYNYHPKFWTETVKLFVDYYHLTDGSKVLDVGCAKGFMLHDLRRVLPGVDIRGIDISEYAIENAIEDTKPFIQVGNAKDLSIFKDDEFDLVISINTVHNLPLEDCKQAIREIQRVGKHAFITNDAWRTDEERQRMLKWNLTALTYMHVDDWKKLFNEVGYKGDYFWFIAE